MTRRISLIFSFVVSGLIISGCGYTMIKKSTLRMHRLPADSANIVALQNQVVALHAQCQADSIRYAKLKAAAEAAVVAPAVVPAVPDSVLRAREQEIAALKDQITQLNAELERIKRRLASPKS
jgi:uncharacterized protein involved in exopolysaccharide biosynthesis